MPAGERKLCQPHSPNESTKLACRYHIHLNLSSWWGTCRWDGQCCATIACSLWINSHVKQCISSESAQLYKQTVSAAVAVGGDRPPPEVGNDKQTRQINLWMVNQSTTAHSIHEGEGASRMSTPPRPLRAPALHVAVGVMCGAPVGTQHSPLHTKARSRARSDGSARQPHRLARLQSATICRT